MSKTICQLPDSFETVVKNKRVESSIKAATPGAKKLKEMNKMLFPFFSKELAAATSTPVSTSAATIVTLPGINKAPESQEVSFPAVSCSWHADWK